MITKFSTATPITVVTAYKVVRKTVWSIAETEDLLLFITQGNVQYEVNGEVYNLKRGDLLFLPRGTEYLRKPLDNDYYEVYHLHFYKDGVSVKLADAQRQLITLSARKEDLPIGEYYVTSTVNAEKETQLIIDAFERIISLRENEEVTNSIHQSISAEYILSIMAEKTQPKIISGLKIENLETFPEALKDAVFYIKTHLNEKITLNELCKIALVSPQQLIRYFKKHTGKTPNAYVTDYKINVARDYITRSKELSIKTVAYELGFDDQCYFSRVFTKTTGESPTDYYYRVKNFKNK